ncbi:MAG: hypothetical protein HYR94_18590 [Chloroflexi bacterium]|nr:hypothetical protein [Chloroflexota bacterium]
MQAYRVEVKVQQSGLLTLNNLPLQVGEEVEVIILIRPPRKRPQNPYPLRGLPITYLNPTEPVAQPDWEITQ